MTDTPEQIAAREADEAAAAGRTEGGEAGLKKALSATRGELKAQRDQFATLQTEMQSLKQKAADEETKRLASQNDYKSLYEKTKTDMESLTQSNAKLAEERKRDHIRFNVQREFPKLKESYIEKLFNFDAVKVNEKGQLTGFQEAVASFKTDYPDIIGEQAAASGGSGAGGGGRDADNKNAFEQLLERTRADETAASGAGQQRNAQGPTLAMRSIQATREAIIAGSKKVFGG
jgi:hypothetical protein